LEAGEEASVPRRKPVTASNPSARAKRIFINADKSLWAGQQIFASAHLSYVAFGLPSFWDFALNIHKSKNNFVRANICVSVSIQ
jgi:hypothetical protein